MIEVMQIWIIYFIDIKLVQHNGMTRYLVFVYGS